MRDPIHLLTCETYEILIASIRKIWCGVRIKQLSITTQLRVEIGIFIRCKVKVVIMDSPKY